MLFVVKEFVLSTKSVSQFIALASIASRFPSVQDDNSWINSLVVSIDDSCCSAMDEVPLSIEHIWWKPPLPPRKTSLPLRRAAVNLPYLRGAPRKTSLTRAARLPPRPHVRLQ